MTSGPGTCFLGALMVNGTTGPFVTGWIMLALLGLMAWFAAEKRRRKHFQRFFYSHHLAVAFFFLWQLHGVRSPGLPPRVLACPDHHFVATDVLHDQVCLDVRETKCAASSSSHRHARRPDKPPYCAWSQIGVFWML